MENILKLQQLMKNYDNEQIEDGSWLDHLSASQAFLCCIGAGPWKVHRRLKIQTQAVQILKNNDLVMMNANETFMFPLEWQISMVQEMIKYLQYHDITMTYFQTELSYSDDPMKLLQSATKAKTRAKVLELFVRDFLKKDAFPIDRHVKKALKKNNLPIDSKQMIELCKEAGFDVNTIARVLVSSSREFTGNKKI